MKPRFTIEDQQSEYYPHYQAYHECIEKNPNYHLTEYCKEHDLKVEKFGDWLRSRSIFVTELRQELLQERLQSVLREPTPPSGPPSFIQFKPDNGPDGYYNPELYQGIGITFANGVRLDLRQCTLEQLLTILDEYRPKRSKRHVRTGL